jgi:hypothetical protein
MEDTAVSAIYPLILANCRRQQNRDGRRQSAIGPAARRDRSGVARQCGRAVLAGKRRTSLLGPAGLLRCVADLIFDGEQLTELLAPLELGWKARTQKELALMTDLVPMLKKRAGGRDISGLKAYED